MGVTSVLRAMMTVKPHVPLIKFRKGGKVQETSAMLSPAQGPAPSASKGKIQARPVIEDYQLPAKYRRRPIDEKEIEYINRGGPE